MSTDQIEDNFRHFTNRLLEAEESVHRSGTVPLYSSEALQRILHKYCDIIADDLSAQSCTIQLKLHDLRSCTALRELTEDNGPPKADRQLTPHARLYRERKADEFRSLWKKAGGQIRNPLAPEDATPRTDWRDRILRSPICFPYAIFPKGAMWLAAVNEASPWKPFAGWLTTDLARGLTAEIVQERAAKARDPLTIRLSRGFRKLGEIDAYLWTNKQPSENQSPLYFFTFYAVPIRIHSGGDVVGTIKVENKGLHPPVEKKGLHRPGPTAVHDLITRVLRLTPDRNVPAVLDALGRALDDIKEQVEARGYSPRPCSLVSLVYLAHDLAASMTDDPSATIRSLMTIGYDSTNTLRQSTPPPVQVFFHRIEDEETLFAPPPADDTSESKQPRWTGAWTFYEMLNQHLATRVEKPAGVTVDTHIKDAVEAALSGGWQCRVEARGGRAPEFAYSVTVSKGDVHIAFTVQVCPSRAEALDAAWLRHYYQLSGSRPQMYVRGLNEIDSSALPPALSGERAAQYKDIIHLATDRLAARVIAFTSAFPIPTFSPEDAWKLSWAAVEIGKLIERQISYRGTHSAPVVPLTSDDFHRIPISDLSFVDAVRRQYSQVQAIQNALAYHLKNYSRDLKFDDRVRLTHRVKDFRSYFDRLGQAHRARYDGLIAVWAFIFARKLTFERLEFGESERAKLLIDAVRDLAAKMENLWQTFDDEEKKVCSNWAASLDTWLNSQAVYPDLKFIAPPLRLEEERREAAIHNIRENLNYCPNGCKAPVSPIPAAELGDLLFRRYDPYIGLAVSLYLQLQNGAEYVDFVDSSRRVLDAFCDRLEASEDQLRRIPLDEKVREFIAALTTLKTRMSDISTRELTEIAGIDLSLDADTQLLRFTIPGIFKRMRTLANIATNQMTPAMLHWENARFDYIGSRITCLFKNQVFGMYEELWNRGDPFRALTVDRGGMSRQRWLCLRTKVHTGTDGYNAWQISALMDPDAGRDDHWNNSFFNLNSLSRLIASVAQHWHGDRDKYKRQAEHRASLKEAYSRWLSFAMSLLDDPLSTATAAEVPFGSYLGQTCFDMFVYVLQKYHGAVDAAHLLRLLEAIEQFIKEAEAYSHGVIAVIRGEQDPAAYQPTPRLIESAEGIYSEAKALAMKLPSDTPLQGQLTRLDPEHRTFQAMLDRGRSKVPVVFVDGATLSAVTRLKRLVEASRGGGIDGSERSVLHEQLEAVVRQIQLVQMDYLFDSREKEKAPPRRGAAEVMDRILCYLLLYRDSAAQQDCVSYDWFYYLMSLVPVELQVRTALADTMADQYHPIYKVGADQSSDQSSASLMQQGRLKEIAPKLDRLDREMEVQFEDYIAHRRIIGS